MPIVIEFHVITKATVNDKLDVHDSYMALSWNDYLTLGQYMKNINAYVEQQNVVVKFYER